MPVFGILDLWQTSKKVEAVEKSQRCKIPCNDFLLLNKCYKLWGSRRLGKLIQQYALVSKINTQRKTRNDYHSYSIINSATRVVTADFVTKITPNTIWTVLVYSAS